MSVHEDERGVITDLLEAAGAVTRITTLAGAVRGNHYHEKTWQAVTVVEGRLLMAVQWPGRPRSEFEVGPGHTYVSPPTERHAWRALEDTECLVLTVGPRSGESYESDVIRLEVPLIS